MLSGPVLAALGAGARPGGAAPLEPRSSAVVPAGRAHLRLFAASVSQTRLFPLPGCRSAPCGAALLFGQLQPTFPCLGGGAAKRPCFGVFPVPLLPKHPGLQKGNYVQPVSTRGFSRTALRRPWVSRAAAVGSGLLPAAVHKDPECGHLLHLRLSQQHRVAEREEFIRQNRILKVFSLGYVKSTNPRAKACKMTVLNLPPSLRGHRVPLVLLHVDISVLTNHGLEAVSFKSVIPTVPLGWFLAVPSSLWFMHPTRDFRQRFSSFQTLANITLLKRYDYVGEHLAL